MPFQWPADYLPAIVSPQQTPERALWFVFSGSHLLVSAAPPVTLPRVASLETLAPGWAPRRWQYLGMLATEHCYSAEVEAKSEPPAGWVWQNLRVLFGVLDDSLFALAGRALQLIDWDRTHQFCGACGAATQAKIEERSRQCPDCGLVVYPRIAPAVMCLARRGSQLLLGRSPRFPEGMYSALAGFVEPGETLEQCVEREVREEVGIRVRNLRYFGSQPWPFPHSLMIAFHAELDSGEICVDRVEIEDAQWFDIERLPKLPAKISVARRLIDAALAEIREAQSGGAPPRDT
jgi:NAD+ diphosphatase